MHSILTNSIMHTVVPYQATRQNILNLSKRMVLSFCSGITSSGETFHWTLLSGNGIDDVRLMSMPSLVNDPVRPHGLVMSASVCFMLPILPKIVSIIFITKAIDPRYVLFTILFFTYSNYMYQFFNDLKIKISNFLIITLLLTNFVLFHILYNSGIFSLLEAVFNELLTLVTAKKLATVLPYFEQW